MTDNGLEPILEGETVSTYLETAKSLANSAGYGDSMAAAQVYASIAIADELSRLGQRPLMPLIINLGGNATKEEVAVMRDYIETMLAKARA